MNLTAIALEKRAISYFAIFLIVVGGIYSYFQLGQLEDPDFSVKTAAIVTTYPGVYWSSEFEGRLSRTLSLQL